FSASLPGPVMPQARYPLPGSTIVTPRLRKIPKFCWVAACSHILTIIAGDPAEFGNFAQTDRKSTRLNSSHLGISYVVFCLTKKSDSYHDLLAVAIHGARDCLWAASG